jgi:hypothetical protein
MQITKPNSTATAQEQQQQQVQQKNLPNNNNFKKDELVRLMLQSLIDLGYR